jgi:two-component system, LytTR family, response regulator
MIKVCIVDDKIASIELLKWLITENCPDITDIRTALNVENAISIIHSFQPDIVFLDVKMPQQSGFDLLNRIGKQNFEVVFTTAYDEYAIQAIKFSALDYLLKPIDSEELIKAVERYKVKKEIQQDGSGLFRNFVSNLENTSKRIALPGHKDIKYVEINQIVRLQADRNYTNFHFKDGKEFFSAKTLKEYEEMLSNYNFIRIHRTHLVNETYIKSYSREGFIVLESGEQIEVSRRKKDQVLRILKQSN